MPLPRGLALSLLAISMVVSLLPSATAELTVGGLLVGSGTVYTFTAYESGFGASGAGFTHTEVCTDCLIQFTLTIDQPGFVLAQTGAMVPLVPGSYELRDFVGYFSYTMNAPHDFTIVLAGMGEVNRVG
ncbi:MAG: hypothetical protein WDA16_15110 [Candidatus Thermoplasmatota archaeon]